MITINSLNFYRWTFFLYSCIIWLAKIRQWSLTKVGCPYFIFSEFEMLNIVVINGVPGCGVGNVEYVKSQSGKPQPVLLVDVQYLMKLELHE